MKAEEHVHYWIIKTANGPISEGVCKICKAVREFRNTLAEAAYTKFKLNKEVS